MNLQNKSTAELKPEEKEFIERMKNTDFKGGSITYSSQGVANYVKAIQEGNIEELLKKINKK